MPVQEKRGRATKKTGDRGTKRIKKELPVIGWREWAGLPDLGLEEIKVKIDTGARSSALHAFEIHEFERDGKLMVSFVLHPYQRDNRITIHAEAELAGYRRVRNPGGRIESRPCIRTRIKLLGKEWIIDLTLTNRDMMGFRMLLGRQAVRGRFLVHAGRSYLARKVMRKKKNN
ncbi:ATP-dependent zinc protease [Candidatus Neomarinimicrobiota bacterium]